MRKKNIFGELMEGVAAMKGHRGGKLTLRSYKVEAALVPKVEPARKSGAKVRARPARLNMRKRNAEGTQPGR